MLEHPTRCAIFRLKIGLDGANFVPGNGLFLATFPARRCSMPLDAVPLPSDVAPKPPDAVPNVAPVPPDATLTPRPEKRRRRTPRRRSASSAPRRRPPPENAHRWLLAVRRPGGESGV